MRMQTLAGFGLLIAGHASFVGCGERTPSAGAQYVRPTSLDTATAGLRVDVANHIPPRPATAADRPDTVYHVNAFLCARRAAVPPHLGNPELAPLALCKPLQGTIHNGDRAPFHLSAADSADLMAIDQGRVSIEFTSTGQCSAEPSPCRGDPIVLPRAVPERLHRLTVEVLEAHCGDYDCSTSFAPLPIADDPGA